MGARQVKPDINYPQYQAKFRQTAQDCQAGPVQERQCKDICCLVTFIILTLAFICVGMYFIVNIDSNDFQRMRESMANSTTTSKSQYQKNSSYSVSTNSSNARTAQHHLLVLNHLIDHQSHHQASIASNNTASSSQQFPDLLQALPWIIFMSIFALILSLVLVIAISKVPKIIIYGLIGFTFVLIISGIIGGLVLGVVQLTIISALFGLIWGILILIMFCCYKQQFNAALVLLKVTGNFLRQKPTVLLAPILVMFISYFYFAFWFISFIGIQLDRNQWIATTSQQSGQPQYQFDYHDVVSIFWLFLNLFYSYFLYYVMVFLIATATALWYFNIEGNYIVKGLGHIWNSHIGSLTFAAMIVTVINMLKSATDNKNNQNSNFVVSCCLCMVRCCLTFLEEIMKVLNHNSIIVMSVTGQDFIDSAKSAIYLIYNNFGLFVAVDMVEFLLKVCVLFLTILLPTGLGLILLKLTYNQGINEEDMYLLISGIIILIICLLISLLTTTVLSEALSCVFILYCLDERFKTLNYGAVNRVPGDLRGLFNEIQSQGRSVNVENFYRDSKQISF